MVVDPCSSFALVDGRWSVVGGRWSIVGSQWSVVHMISVCVVMSQCDIVDDQCFVLSMGDQFDFHEWSVVNSLRLIVCGL